MTNPNGQHDPAMVTLPLPDTDRSDTSYEVALDDPSPPTTPQPVDPPAEQRRPLFPPIPRPDTLVEAIKHTAGRWSYIALWQALRSPGYVAKALVWSLVGAGRLAVGQVRWWWVIEEGGLRQKAASDNDPATWLKLHREVKLTRRNRGLVIALELVALTTLGLLAWRVPPRWWLLPVAGVLVAWLAHYGHPAHAPIVTSALVTPRFRKLTGDIVLRAYYAAGLGDPDKEGQKVEFGSPMARDGAGSRVLVFLPRGKGLDDALKAKPKIASGLDVSLSQVFITRDPASHRSHTLWVADRDPLAVSAGRTPLLRCKPTDIWTPAPFGLDERGQRVSVPLLWHSILIGAQPRIGKTFSGRLLALYGALDPYVQLSVFDASGKPDWRKFALVAQHCAFGLTMTRDGDPIEILIHSLRALKTDVQDRYQRLSGMPAEVCPEGKLTRALARDPEVNMPVRLVVLDEFHEYFDTDDPAAGKEIAGLLLFLVRVAPGAGVSLVSLTQKPSGIGSGQTEKAFTAYRDNHQIRFALKTGSYHVSDSVLGSGAHAEGYDSSTLLTEYKGVGILRGAWDTTPTVRTHLADIPDADKILTAARRLREQHGTLTGYAAGQPTVRDSRDVLADVRSVYHPGETFASWQELATRLAERIPEHYADLNKDALSAQVRALDVPSVDGKQDGRTVKGAKRTAIEAALTHRQQAAS